MAAKRSRDKPMSPDEPIIEFKVKDLFLQIKADLDLIKNALGSKADKLDLEKLEAEVGTLKSNMAAKAAVEDVQNNIKATKLQWISIAATSIVAVIGIIVELLRH